MKIMKPLNNNEIRSILTETLHGNLPRETMQRVLTTLAEVPKLRTTEKAVDRLQDYVDDPDSHPEFTYEDLETAQLVIQTIEEEIERDSAG